MRWLILGLMAVSIGLAISRFNSAIPTIKSQPTSLLEPHHLGKKTLVAKVDRSGSVKPWMRAAWSGASNDPFHTVRFAPTVQAPVVAHADVATQEKPSAPPFPYHFFGRMVDIDGNMLTFFIRDGNLIPVREGTVLDEEYHIDLVSESHVQVTYLPLNERLAIVLPSAAR